MTADYKAVGTDDEDHSGPVFLALLLRKTQKKGRLSATIYPHLQHTFTWPWALFCVAFNSRIEVWWYTERQVVHCLLLSLLVCVLICWKWHWKVLTGASGYYWLVPPNLFSGIVFLLHSDRIITLNELTEEVCWINHSVCLMRSVQMHVCETRKRKRKIFWGFYA